MEDNREHYKILEIDETATKEDIRKAFKKQALRWHPDKHPPENKVVAEEIFKKVAMAYEVLSGNAKTQFFKEDVFSSFFAKFFQKYQKWGDDWTSPENKEARKKATAALWEEEDLKYTDQKNIRIRNLKIKYPEDIETWPEYAATKNMPIHSITSFEHNEVLNSKICFWNGHIYSLAVDAICNSTDSSLSGSGCLDSTLHCFAGMKLREECLLMDECPIGQAVITRAYELPAKYIIHCIGPNNRDPHALASCYYSALDLAVEHKIRTIAFPCVATGLNCFPIHASAQIVLQTTRRWLEKDNNWNKIDKIIFVFWRTVEEICYSTWAPTVFPLPSTLTYSEAILQDEVKTIHYWAKNSSFLDKWVYGEENNQNSVIPPEPHSSRDSAIHFLDEEDDPPKDIDNFDFGYLSDLSSDEEDGRVSDDSSIKEKEGGVRDDMSIKEKDGGVSDDRSIKEKEGGVSDDRSIKEKGGVSDDMSIKEKGGVCDDMSIKEKGGVRDDSSIKEKEGGVSDDMSIKEKGGVCDDRSIKEKDGSGVCTKEKCDDDGDDDRDEKDGSGIGDKMFNRIYRKFM